jgi:hypothetical protein
VPVTLTGPVGTSSRLHPFGVMIRPTSSVIVDRIPENCEESDGMAIGPVEHIIVAFPGNQFTGDIARAAAAPEPNSSATLLN